MDIYSDKTYLNSNPSWHEEDAGMKATAIAELLAKHSLSTSSVAEVGCGSGEILVQLENKISGIEKLYGFDISTDALGIASKKQTEKIRFELLDLAASSEPIHHFNLILVIDVLEHIPDYFSFLEGIQRKSDFTIFHIPLDMSVWSLFREKILIESKNRVGHIHAFTEELILDTLNAHGFDLLDKIYTPPTYTHLSFKQKLTDGVRKIIFSINKKFATKAIGGYSIMVLTKNRARSPV